MNPRVAAATVINQVTDGKSLAEVLPASLISVNDPRDRALVQAICYGVCRNYFRLDVILSLLMDRPMKAKDSDVHSLILVGLYQLMDMRIPPHAAVAETVDAAEKLKKPWAKGLINAILRNFLRNKDKIDNEINADDEAKYSHPRWWINETKKAWSEHWEKVLTANNAHPPMALRINLNKISRDAYIEKLKAASCDALPIAETKAGIILSAPMNADDLPGFKRGDISVQDGAAQLAAELLMLQPGQHVLDACAAPGGKLTHILELEPKLASVIAVEKDQQRIKKIEENLAREQLTARLICADANDINAWWDKEQFDRILLDAPCSASGVVRRHPDIKLLRQQTDLKNLAQTQLQLLESLWPTLKRGGILVYATCSIFPIENEAVLQKFLEQHQDAKEDKINVTWGVACKIGRQILPGMQDMDGFYYARLIKS